MLAAVILFIMLGALFLFRAVANVAVDAIYERMDAQARYYVDSVDYQLEEITRQQADFFSNRQLAFLVDRELLSNDYDRREALLSVQERLFSLASSNELIKQLTLYIPGSNYVITPGSIKGMDAEKEERLAMLKRQMGELIKDGDELVYTLAETQYQETHEPNFYLELVLDNRQLSESLNTFAPKEGGACLVHTKLGWFLEDGWKRGPAGEILEKLLADGTEFGRMTKVTVGRDTYLVSTAKSEFLGLLVQYYAKDQVLGRLNHYRGMFVVFFVVTLCLSLLFSRYTEKMVHIPLRRLYQAFGVLQLGNTDIQISHRANDEFEYIYEGFNHMTDELHRLIDEVYVQKNLTQKAELKQLQTQINPHFLYNSFFLLSRWVKAGDMENAELMADYLGRYFRFLTRNASDTVKLQKEIEHAECYAKIQGTRFKSRITVELSPLPEEAENMEVPRLIVQPVLENAFEHGLEDREENGVLKVSYEISDGEVRILIENNGVLSEEDIAKLQARLRDDYEGEVTGLVNIHHRLRSFFKGKGGVEVKRGPLGGLLVILHIARG